MSTWVQKILGLSPRIADDVRTQVAKQYDAGLPVTLIEDGKIVVHQKAEPIILAAGEQAMPVTEIKRHLRV
jgi:hypothetical protein